MKTVCIDQVVISEDSDEKGKPLSIYDSVGCITVNIYRDKKGNIQGVKITDSLLNESFSLGKIPTDCKCDTCKCG